MGRSMGGLDDNLTRNPEYLFSHTSAKTVRPYYEIDTGRYIVCKCLSQTEFTVYSSD